MNQHLTLEGFEQPRIPHRHVELDASNISELGAVENQNLQVSARLDGLSDTASFYNLSVLIIAHQPFE
jgi:hypothetical protein